MAFFLLVDDHVVVRQGLKQILADEFDDSVFGEAGDADEALHEIRKRNWDLMLLDISMPGRSGLALLHDIRHHCPHPPVVVLSMHPEREYAVRALQAGAAAYFTKDCARDELVRGIRKVLSGGKYVSPSLAESVIAGLAADSARPRHSLLSDREYEIMCALARGKRLSDIAAELSLSIKTISTYRHRVLQKMRMTSNAELTRYALEKGLLS